MLQLRLVLHFVLVQLVLWQLLLLLLWLRLQLRLRLLLRLLLVLLLELHLVLGLLLLLLLLVLVLLMLVLVQLLLRQQQQLLLLMLLSLGLGLGLGLVLLLPWPLHLPLLLLWLLLLWLLLLLLVLLLLLSVLLLLLCVCVIQLLLGNGDEELLHAWCRGRARCGLHHGTLVLLHRVDHVVGKPQSDLIWHSCWGLGRGQHQLPLRTHLGHRWPLGHAPTRAAALAGLVGIHSKWCQHGCRGWRSADIIHLLGTGVWQQALWQLLRQLELRGREPRGGLREERVGTQGNERSGRGSPCATPQVGT